MGGGALLPRSRLADLLLPSHRGVDRVRQPAVELLPVPDEGPSGVPGRGPADGLKLLPGPYAASALRAGARLHPGLVGHEQGLLDRDEDHSDRARRRPLRPQQLLVRQDRAGPHQTPLRQEEGSPRPTALERRAHDTHTTAIRATHASKRQLIGRDEREMETTEISLGTALDYVADSPGEGSSHVQPCRHRTAFFLWLFVHLILPGHLQRKRST